MPTCAFCKASIPEASKFCPHCGKPGAQPPASKSGPGELEDMTVTAVSLPPLRSVPNMPTSHDGAGSGGGAAVALGFTRDDAETPPPPTYPPSYPQAQPPAPPISVVPPGPAPTLPPTMAGTQPGYHAGSLPATVPGTIAGLSAAGNAFKPPRDLHASPTPEGRGIFESLPGPAEAQNPRPDPRQPHADRNVSIAPPPRAYAPEVMLGASAELGRFVPGTILGNRYRIVGRLGKGGMGDVYRAEDLKLGQTCAVKFLPEQMSHDRAALLRLFNEVKVARQVSHPNVCRVYDLGEMDGMHFISMEYVDGEDLASLLRRIGRLPADKAIQVARQLCAGLAAAHEKGVLHRDLKPANVMIDGRGHVRIMDFGLAGLAEELAKDSGRAGTPAYMAPEQLAGKGVSTRSDVFALGLLLFEIFSGRPMFRPESMADLARMHRQPLPTLRSVVPDAGERVEDIISRCLEREPENRPASALGVATMLPGGDALAAAIAAGETPSPAMVAASGSRGGMPLAIAASLTVALCAGVFSAAALNTKIKLFAQSGLEKSPEFLADKSRTILTQLGHPTGTAPLDSALGFEELRPAPPANSVSPSTPAPALPPDSMSAPAPASSPGEMVFWYRQSPDALVSPNGRRVTREYPAVAAGGARVVLSPTGELRQLSAPLAAGNPGGAGEPDWNAVLTLMGLDPAAAKIVTSAAPYTPPVFATSQRAWSVTDAAGKSTTIQAAAVGSSIVYASRGDSASVSSTPAEDGATSTFAILLLLALLVYGLPTLLAVWNIRQRRGDLKSATRLAIIVFAVSFLGWLFAADVPANANLADDILFSALARATFSGMLCWLIYMALEPIVRRRWPQSLVSWSRLLGGNWRDPLVGRELLIGSLLGVFWILLIQGLYLLLERGGAALPPRPIDPNSLLGALPALSVLLSSLSSALFATLGVALLCTLPRLVFKNATIANVVQFAVLALVFAVMLLAQTGSQGSPLVAGVGLLAGVAAAAVLARAGLLTLMSAFAVAGILWNLPVSLTGPSWYLGSSAMAIAASIGVGLLGVWIAMGRRVARPAA